MKKNIEAKLIRKAYTNRLKTDFKAGLDNFSLDYFINYLKYIRDSYIVNVDMTKKEKRTSPKLISITAALEEYNKYENCINKYYIVDNKTKLPVQSKKAGNQKDIMKAYLLEKNRHWKCFWGLVELDIQEWLDNEDKI